VTELEDPEADAFGTVVVENARVVTPDSVVEGGVRIEGDRIAAVGEDVAGGADRRIDAGGRLVVPGLTDLHGDDVEAHVFPRSGVRVDTPVAFQSADRANVAAGITTKFHAVSFIDRPSDDRSVELARKLAEEVAETDSLLADHRFHARCEVTSDEAVVAVEDVVDRGLADLVSVMTHIPGHGQYRDYDTFEKWFETRSSRSREEARKQWDETRGVSRADIQAAAERVVDVAQDAGVPTASHDDGTREEVEWAADQGVDICEYPITVEAARAGVEAGLVTGMGAPNLVRGGSQSGNVATADAIAAGAVDALLVDYHPPSLLNAVFVDTGEPLPERVARVTKTPAEAVGLSGRGRLDPGARADLVVVETGKTPTVRRVLVAGREVYRAGVPV
jgi:alpha-D-ribose 1-methylphosphonate 5-triphosphate diphosphatase